LAAQQLHPTVERWKQTYEQSGWQAFMAAVDKDTDRPKGDPRTFDPRQEPQQRLHLQSAPPGRLPDQTYWQRLSSYLTPGSRRAGGGGGDRMVSWSIAPKDFRGAGYYLAPYAGVHLQMFTPAGSARRPL
jgi:hypothetical protein